MISTVHEFVEAIGGNKTASEAFGVTPQSIWNWRDFGRFPAWATPYAKQLADRHNLIVKNELLAISKWGERKRIAPPKRAKPKSKSKNKAA